MSNDEDYKIKLQSIDALINKYKDSPEQGSEDWLKLKYGDDDELDEYKKYGCIGGSEISIITGDNKYCNLRNFIKERVGLKDSSYTDNIFTRWGSVFECQIQKVIEIVMKCKILNTGSIKGSIPFHRYSPDGLATMKLMCQAKWACRNDIELYVVQTDEGFDLSKKEQNENDDEKMVSIKKYINVLLEFKCPFSRIPNHIIPREYTPQIKAGLCDLVGYCDIALFVNSSFRKCSYKDWKFNNIYDTEYHRFDAGKYKSDVQEKFNLPIAIGGLCVYIPLKDIINCPMPPRYGTPEYTNYQYKKRKRDNIINRGEYGEETLIDLGNDNDNQFDTVMKMLRSKELYIYTIHPKIYPDELEKIKFIRDHDIKTETSAKFSRSKNLHQFKNWCYDREYIPLGYIPWKLLVCDMIIQKFDPLYLDKCKDKISEVIKIIRDLKSIGNMADRESRFLELTNNLTYSNGKEIKKQNNARPTRKKISKKILNDIINDL